MQSADSGFLKILGDKLREYPKSRCNSSTQCIQMVKSGSHVYTSVRPCGKFRKLNFAYISKLTRLLFACYGVTLPKKLSKFDAPIGSGMCWVIKRILIFYWI